MTTNREAWLALTAEEPIEPDLPICDPHHHFWDRPDNRYLLDDLLQDTGGGHNIVETVFWECSSMYRKDGPAEMQPVGETEFVQGIAAQSASGQYGPTAVAAGIVGFADLTLGDGVAPVLDAHVAASQNRFRGIRHSAAWDDRAGIGSYKNPRNGVLLEPAFRDGFAQLQKHGLSFDAWLYHTQLMDLADLARAFPEAPIILNHIGGPIGVGPYADEYEKVFEQWKQGIAAVAANPKVVVKLGGLGMTFCGFDWHERTKPIGSEELAESMAPYYLYCIEQFGADRCMFESNFPVDKASYSYSVMWNAFKRIAADFSSADKAAMFHDTAARVYRLTNN